MSTAVAPSRSIQDYLSSLCDLSSASLKRFSPGDPIFQQDEPGNTGCVITQGQVVVRRGSPLRDIAVLGSGDFIGEHCLINPGAVRTASIVAQTDVELLELSTFNYSDQFSTDRFSSDQFCYNLKELSKIRLRERLIDFTSNEREFRSPDIASFRCALLNMRYRMPEHFDSIVNRYDRPWIDLFCGASGVLTRKLRGLGFSDVTGVDLEKNHLSNDSCIQADVVDHLSKQPDSSVAMITIVNFLEDHVFDAPQGPRKNWASFPHHRLGPLVNQIARSLEPQGKILLISGDRANNFHEACATAGLRCLPLMPNDPKVHLFLKQE